MPHATPRRLAFCITELDPGGAERALVDIVTRLPRDLWTPHVFSLGPEAPLAAPLRDADVPVTCLGARSGYDLMVVDRLRRELRRWKPELLQTFLFHANVTGRLAGRMAGVPVIVSGLRVAERERGWHNRLERWTRILASHHVAVSRGVADFARTQLRFPANQITVIPNGVDAEALNHVTPVDWSDLGLPASTQVLLAAGRLHRQKGFDVLIEAVGPLLKSHPDWVLVIAGEGPLRRELEEQIGRQGLTGRVLLPGWTPHLRRYLKGARLFVLSSRWEGMPNVLLEAIASRTPVLATDAEGVSELLGEVAPQRIVPRESVLALRQGIEHAMAEGATSTSTEDSLYLFISEKFRWNSVAQDYSALYARLLTTR